MGQVAGKGNVHGNRICEKYGIALLPCATPATTELQATTLRWYAYRVGITCTNARPNRTAFGVENMMGTNPLTIAPPMQF